MKSPLRVVVIGGVACGPKAASRLKRLLPTADITVVEKDDIVSYGACGIPYYVEGFFSDLNMLVQTPVGITRDPVFFEKVKGVRVLTKTEAVHIDRDRKIVRVRSLDNNAESDLPFDKLVLSTGARPVKPPIPGLELQNVFCIRNLNDAAALMESIEKNKPQEAVLIGAGYIGLEMAEALMQKGLKVTVVEMFDQVLPQFLDKEMSMLVAKHLQKKGVKLLLGQKVLALEGKDSVQSVKIEQQTLTADLVIVAAGVRPNDELARETGLSCTPWGGIEINSYCQTSDPDIYAGGDCVVNRYVHPVTGALHFVPLGSTANKHGRVIANHIAGLGAPFAGVTLTGICKVFDFTVGRTGLTEKQAKELNLEVETAIWAGADIPHYYPQSKSMVIKMVASKSNRKLLGVQIAGTGEASKRLDVAASALFFGANVDHLENIDIGYAPPYGPPLDPLTSAAHLLMNKMDGIASSISPFEAKRRMDGNKELILVDVRTPKEFAKMGLRDERVINIPLGALRERAQELPKDKDILTFCVLCLRGYEAQRILTAAGLSRVWFIEGGLLGWPFDL
jgi:NADPH-dependent 2,4-dienoyl-CoA reductase/sulfur reductase-like enzyme/rhodanese-related sulfurtransferase